MHKVNGLQEAAAKGDALTRSNTCHGYGGNNDDCVGCALHNTHWPLRDLVCNGIVGLFLCCQSSLAILSCAAALVATSLFRTGCSCRQGPDSEAALEDTLCAKGRIELSPTMSGLGEVGQLKEGNATKKVKC